MHKIEVVDRFDLSMHRFIYPSIHPSTHPYNNSSIKLTIHSYTTMRPFNHKCSPNWIGGGGILGYDAVWTCRWIPTFRSSILSPSSGLKMEVITNLPTNPHGVTTQKITISIFSAVRTWIWDRRWNWWERNTGARRKGHRCRKGIKERKKGGKDEDSGRSYSLFNFKILFY
jgi:hypothetical protein